MKTGVFGGTFNPIHNSHLYLAEQYLEKLDLDRILFVPTYTPPHKQALDLADAADRLAMCRFALEGQSRFQVCDYEVEQKNVSYTWKTLEYLGRAKSRELYLLMGADMFLTVQKWKRPEIIYQNAVLCAAARQEGEWQRLTEHRRFLEMQGARCRVLPMPPKPMSSTQVRRIIAAGEDAGPYLPAKVWRYIRERRLYGYREEG